MRSERYAIIGQVARGIGHELGNVLQRIMGKIDLSLIEKDAAKIQEHLVVAMKASERAGIIIRNLQSFSRTEPVFQHESVQVPLDESLSLISHELVKSSVTLVKNIQPTPKVKIDTGGLAQVFLNLLINAIHAMPQGGEVKVTIEPVTAPEPLNRPCVVIRLADSGTGIPPEVLPKIFDYAFSTKGDLGSGLGLAVSKDIVESHGGQISVKTELGKGTEFSIWIPLAKEI
jgi:two-component system NtrC family sensor kinase